MKPNQRFGRFLQWVLAWKPGSARDSNTRRAFMRVCLLWCLGYGLWLVLAGGRIEPSYSVAMSLVAVALVGCSLLVFAQVVLLMPFRNAAGFVVDARRLMADTIISSPFTMTVFSLVYRNVGLTEGGVQMQPTAREALYFSIVTFSTLGYGDFVPSPAARLIAASEALLGNLHLGMLVGSTFAALRR